MIAKRLFDLVRTDQTRLDELRREMWEEITAETSAALGRLEAKHGELVREVAGKMDERAVLVLFAQLHAEAMKSAARDRLRLMCAAIAGIFTPQIDLEMKSRIARAITQLQPSDVICLRRIAGFLADQHVDVARVLSSAVGIDALKNCGCVSVDAAGEDFSRDPVQTAQPLELTGVGRALLSFVETWQEGDEVVTA